MIATISLTNSCNYSCGYCIAGNNFKTAKSKICSKFGYTEIKGCILDLDAVLMFLDKFVPCGSTIVLTGGEPMTVPYFGALMRVLSTKYRIIIETNGSQLFKFPEGIGYSNIRLLVAWHPKMILWDKFYKNIQNSKFPPEFIKYVQIVVYEDGKKTEINKYPDGLPVIVNDGARPDCGVPINEPYIFVRPNGKVMGCPSAEKQIGDIYEGTLDANDLFGYAECRINGYVFCNSFKNVYSAFE